jgi:hypothetical protein
MKLEIGTRSYQFKIVPGKLRARNGQRCATLCDHSRRQILVSESVPLQVRSEIVALAVSEAWKHQAFHGEKPAIPFVGAVR